MNAAESILVIITELIFGVLAVFTQYAALRSNKGYIELVHGIAWGVEVLITVSSFFLLVLFSTTAFAITGFILGLLVLAIGTFLLYNAIKS